MIAVLSHKGLWRSSSKLQEACGTNQNSKWTKHLYLSLHPSRFIRRKNVPPGGFLSAFDVQMLTAVSLFQVWRGIFSCTSHPSIPMFPVSATENTAPKLNLNDRLVLFTSYVVFLWNENTLQGLHIIRQNHSLVCILSVQKHPAGHHFLTLSKDLKKIVV